MIPVKKKMSNGVITFHTPFSVSLLKSQECTTYMKDTTETRKRVFLPSERPRSISGCSRGGKNNEESSTRPKLDPTQDWLPHTSLRQLQAKMEEENQQVKKIIKPLLDTENGFMKELETFLRRWDVTQLRRRELLHKRWTEQVWFPLQKRVEERVSSCKPHFKLHKDPLYLQLHHRQEEKRIAPSREAGYKYTQGHVEMLLQSDHLLIESVMPQTKTPLQASSNYPASASRKTPVEDETEERETSRLNIIPYHLRATATSDGRCRRTSCWFSRCGCRQQPPSLRQLQSMSTSK